MNKAKLNIVINVLAFIAGLISTVTGIILMVGTKGMSGIKQFHGFISIAFVVLISIHLVMHWRWIKCVPQLWRCK